jgi:hypothetical protein
MTNSKALFYPSIEIHNENWLKSSLLFWDELYTIVPERMRDPYRNETTKYLYEKELLKPEFVNPDHHLIKDLSGLIIRHLNTEEGLQLLSNSQERGLHRMTSRDPWMWMGREMERGFRMHPDKLSHELQHYLEGEILDDWIWTDSSFAEFYMTILSNMICDDKGLKLLTDNASCASLSEKVRLGNNKQEVFSRRPDRLNQQIAQGLMVNLIIKSLNFHSSTNIVDVISFKNDHQDLLGTFRTNIKKLLKEIPNDVNLVTLKEEIESIYHDEFLPSYNTLTKSLDNSKIKWIADNIMKVGFFSVSTTSIPLHFLGLSIPYALLAGAGVSLIASSISYNIEQKNKLQKNPYTYLMKINESL